MKTVERDLTALDAENLWILFNTVQIQNLPKDPGIAFAVYELRESLNEMKMHPDDDSVMDDNAKLEIYIKENNLSPNLFTKRIIWEMPRRLAPVLKEILRQAVQFTTGQGMSTLFDLCKNMKLNGWFIKNFNKPMKLEVEDDCDFDDEIEDDFDDVPVGEAPDLEEDENEEGIEE